MADATPDFRQFAQALREDEQLAEQYHGSLEILSERIKTDPTLNAAFGDCTRFLRMVKSLRLRLERAAGGEAGVGLEPARLQGLIDEWQEARGPFRDGYLRDRDYLETLAKRIVP